MNILQGKGDNPPAARAEINEPYLSDLCSVVVNILQGKGDNPPTDRTEINEPYLLDLCSVVVNILHGKGDNYGKKESLYSIPFVKGTSLYHIFHLVKQKTACKIHIYSFI